MTVAETLQFFENLVISEIFLGMIQLLRFDWTVVQMLDVPEPIRNESPEMVHPSLQCSTISGRDLVLFYL